MQRKIVAMMIKRHTKELRAVPRFNLQNPIRLQGSTLPLVVKASDPSRAVDGHVQNISSGGLCLLAKKRLKVSELLMGEIAVPGTQARIPTLLQVRWLHKSSFGTGYRAGLHFVLQAGMTQALPTPTKLAGLSVTDKDGRRKSPRKKS